MSLEKLERLASITLSSVTVVAIIAGGLFGLFEYLDHKASEKINHSLNQLSNYNSDSLVKSRESIDEAWNGRHTKLIELFKKDKSDSAYSKFVLDVVNDSNLSRDIEKILRFYQETAICVGANICDEETTRSFFQADAVPFFSTFYPYVCFQRKQWKDEKTWEKLQLFYRLNSIGKICG